MAYVSAAFRPAELCAFMKAKAAETKIDYQFRCDDREIAIFGGLGQYSYLTFDTWEQSGLEYRECFDENSDENFLREVASGQILVFLSNDMVIIRWVALWTLSYYSESHTGGWIDDDYENVVPLANFLARLMSTPDWDLRMA